MTRIEASAAHLRRSSAIAVAALLALTGLIAGCGSTAGQPPAAHTSVVVDTDMSWDDITALAFLLSRRDTDVKAIAIDGDGLTHCDSGVLHARQIAAHLGHPQIPVGCGRTVPLEGSAAFPDGWRQNADAFFGLKLPAVSDLFNTPTAVQVLTNALRSAPRTVLISLGPMTNLAEVFALHPDLRTRIAMIYAMAGALDVPGNEIVQGRAEWNVFIDPVAASDVFKSGVPVTLVPLDATDDLPVTIFFRDALTKASSSAAGGLVKSLLNDPYYYSGAQYFWDPAAAAIAVDNSLGRFANEDVSVELTPGPDLGRLVRSPTGARMRIAVDVDAPAFYQRYLATVVGDVNVTLKLPANSLEVAYGPGGWKVNNATVLTTGPLAVSLSNVTDSGAGLVVARLAPGHTVAEVDALIAQQVSSVPEWFQIVLTVTVPKGHPATWGVQLEPGTWVAVGGGPGISLQRLAAVEVP